VTQKDQGRDPIMFDVHYLENGWRYRLGCNRVMGYGESNDLHGARTARCRLVCRLLSALYAIGRPSVCPSVRRMYHRKRLKLGLWNFQHTVAPSLWFFCRVSFIPIF